MQAIQRGQQVAVELLVRRYHRQLLAYFYRLAGDYHLAQDLAQECLFRLISRAELYRYPQPLKPWLYQIAVNLWRDHAKRAVYRRERELLPLDAAEEIPDGEPWPEEAVADRLLAESALVALSSLPPHYAQVLLLRLSQGLTVPEIATVLDLPQGTIKSRIFHGLRQLRALILAQEVTPDERSTGVR